MNSMRVGTLPTDNGVNYRANSLTYESGPGMSDLTGGWLTGGGAGNLKMTMPTAFATSMLAWGLLSFPKGFSESGQTASTLENVRCEPSTEHEHHLPSLICVKSESLQPCSALFKPVSIGNQQPKAAACNLPR